MSRKQKIGIFTFPYSINYGAILLTYAIQKALCDLGMDAIILGYDQEHDDFSTSDEIKDIVTKLQKHRYNVEYIIQGIRRKMTRRLLCALFYKQTSKFEKFRKQHIHMTDRLDTVSKLNSELKDYDVALVGGDQAWNVMCAKMFQVPFLGFDLPKRIRKVSYAPCFGRPDMPLKFEKQIGDSLRDFDSIGVRNRMSQKVVKRLSGRDATVVVDPTLLISFDEITTKTDLGTSMIVSYCIKTSQVRMARIRRVLKKALGCKMLSISLHRQFLLADKWAWNTDPSEWLGIFRNAEYIFTDSFHGTIFALKNRKQFITIVQDPTDIRMIDLLGRYGLEERIVHSVDEVSGELMQQPIDYDRVHEEIARDVQASYEYLKTALA